MPNTNFCICSCGESASQPSKNQLSQTCSPLNLKQPENTPHSATVIDCPSSTSKQCQVYNIEINVNHISALSVNTTHPSVMVHVCPDRWTASQLQSPRPRTCRSCTNFGWPSPGCGEFPRVWNLCQRHAKQIQWLAPQDALNRLCHLLTVLH